MNANDRRKIQREYSRVNGKFTKKHYPKVFKAVNTLVSSLIEDIKRVYHSLDELKIALKGDEVPLRNDVVERLRQYFTITEKEVKR